MRKKTIALVLLLCVFAASLTWVYSQNASLPFVDRVIAYVMSISMDNSQNANLPPANQLIELTEDQFDEFMANQQNENPPMHPVVAKRVLQLSSETLDESFRKLASYDDGQYVHPGYTTNVQFKENHLQRLLSNRRFIKVLQEFENLPPEQAKTKAEEFHRIAMNHYSTVTHALLDEYEKNPYPEANPDSYHLKFMILASLALTASLGDFPLVMQQIDEWGTGPADVRKRLLTMYPMELLETCTLENTFFFDTSSFVSILMFAAERSGTMPENVKTIINEADCEIDDIPLVAWNADRTYYDDLRNFRNGSISGEDAQMVFRIYTFSRFNESQRQQNYEFFRTLQETIASLN